MPDTYFSKFPRVGYDKSSATNITERTVFLNAVLKNPYLFYRTDLSSGTRADHIAGSYYNDPYREWMIYLANDIVDPLGEWYLSSDQLNELVKLKYGSVESAQDKVAYYQTNWAETDQTISPVAYADLATSETKYWRPVYDGSNSITAYERKPEDLTVNTNIVLRYRLIETTTAFTHGEVVDVSLDPSTSGKAQVISSNSTFLTVQHVSGDAFPHGPVVVTGESTATGRESGTQAFILYAQFLANNIPIEERVYWSPVSLYDMETSKNEYNKSIRVLDSSYADKVSLQTRLLLNQ